MLAVVWMTLSFSLMGSVQTNTIGAVPRVRANPNPNPNGWSITFNGGLTSTSEAGLCVIIQCSFTHIDAFKPTSAIWYKCSPDGKCNRDIIFHSVDAMKAQAPFRGRVALLEPDTAQKNCGITINDLTVSDSGSYRFRVAGQLNGVLDTVGYNYVQKKLLNVTGLRQKPQIKLPPALTEGLQTTLTCTAPGLCSGTPPNITWTWRKTGHSALDISLIQSDATIVQTENLTGVGQRHSSNLTFTPSSEHDGSEVACQVTFERNIKSVETVTLNVTYLKMPIIKGNTTVEEGGTLNLTCDAENSPPSTSITWTELGSNKKLQNGTQRASLVIPMVTGEQSARYSCTAKHLNKTLTAFADITVMTFPTILIGSECALRLRTLICVCISEGFPLPTIKWPLLKSRSVYSVVTTVLNSTVNSTLSLNVEDHYNTSVTCFSKNNVKIVNKTLLIIKKDEPKHEVVQNEGFFSGIAEVKTVIAFLIGVSLPITICCLAWTFHRCKERNSGGQSETMQMVTCQNQQTGGGQGVDGGEQTPLGEAPERVGDSEGDQKEVEYASIDYSQLKRRSPCKEAEHKQQTTETEYAEVKREEGNRDQDSGTEYGRMLKREEEEEEEATIVECEDSKTEDREDTALYSNVKAIMAEG